MKLSTSSTLLVSMTVTSIISMIVAETTDNPDYEPSPSSPVLETLVRTNRRRILQPDIVPCSRRLLTLCEDPPIYFSTFMSSLMPETGSVSRKPSAPNRRRSGVNIGSFIMNDERDGLDEPPEELLRPTNRRRKNRN